ncbi:MAG: AraC family transcriptional regulator [Gammaproteobacteria bacterium]|nr:AraC family transcriptional regulator [Gammaproteobacteria bacterium]MDH5302898.1 AraC family transcriptional regulator [Gammaproteobacteria bacterium]MDH5321003.1 AraC family transcriptional regulator [Gammaproteobacteria bacterium]
MRNQQCWTTAGVDGGKRLEFWNETLRNSIFELKFEARESLFDAQLKQHSLGPLRLSRLDISTGHTVTRSEAAIARSPVARINLNYVQRGQLVAEQHRRTCVLTSGDFVLLDSRECYTVASRAETRHVSLQFPVEWLERWLPSPQDCVARPIRRGTPWSATLAATLRDAHSYADEIDGMSDLCAEQLTGALALAIGRDQSGNSTHCRRIYARLQKTLEDLSHVPELEAKDVANALSISPRYLYKILARENTTYCRELMRIRLQRSERMLKDPRFASISVAEIAWRSGFRDPSHFSKRFREFFGCPPGAFRNTSH